MLQFWLGEWIVRLISMGKRDSVDDIAGAMSLRLFVMGTLFISEVKILIASSISLGQKEI